MSEKNSTLVYSTDNSVPGKDQRKDKPGNRGIPAVNRTISGVPAKSGASNKSVTPGISRIIVRLDRKGRGGKSVTAIDGLQLQAEDEEKLLKQLKTKLGTGGTTKNGSIEIQGDHCDEVLAELTKLGYRPKRSGG